MIPPVDFHTHSQFSLDSESKTEDMVKAAVMSGLSHICITEHKDTDPFYEDVAYYKDEPYTAEIARLRKEYGEFITILKGVEIDCQKATMPAVRDFEAQHSFDFVLASVHVLKHRFFDDSYFRDHDPLASYKEYMEEILELSRHSFFDILGHLDYVKRFGSHFLEFNPLFFEKEIRRVLSNVIENNRGIELNTSGRRHDHGETYPSETILRWYREMGGDIITLGSDAHLPEHVGFAATRGIDLLKDIGFDGIWIFENRKGRKIEF